MKIYALETQYKFESHKNYCWFTESKEKIMALEKHIQRTEPDARIIKHVFDAEEIEETY